MPATAVKKSPTKKTTKKKGSPIVAGVRKALQGVRYTSSVKGLTKFSFTPEAIAKARKTPLIRVDGRSDIIEGSVRNDPLHRNRTSNWENFAYPSKDTRKFYQIVSYDDDRYVVTADELRGLKKSKTPLTKVSMGSYRGGNTSSYTIDIDGDDRTLAIGCQVYTFEVWAAAGFIDNFLLLQYGSNHPNIVSAYRSELKALVSFLLQRFPRKGLTKAQIAEAVSVVNAKPAIKIKKRVSKDDAVDHNNTSGL